MTIGPLSIMVYYDFDMPALTREDLDKIEVEMKKIIKREMITRFTLPRDAASSLFQERNEPGRAHRGPSQRTESFPFYQQGDLSNLRSSTSDEHQAD